MVQNIYQKWFTKYDSNVSKYDSKGSNTIQMVQSVILMVHQVRFKWSKHIQNMIQMVKTYSKYDSNGSN